MQTSPSPSPPDFDFNLPCRYFKSSFARSLSMHNGGAGMSDANDMQCKSLDFDIGQYRTISTFNSNSNSNNNNDIQNIDTKSLECPPLPQRRPITITHSTATTTTAKNEAANSMSKRNNTNNNNNNSNNMAYFESDLSDESIEEDTEKPPAIPARCPILVPKSKSAGALNIQHRQQQQQQQQHKLLSQFRNVAIAENANAYGNVVVGVGAAANNNSTTTPTAAAAVTGIAAHGNFNRPINHNKQHQSQQQLQQQQQQLNCQANSNHNNNNNNDAVNSSRIGKSRCNLSNRRNVWPTDRDASQQQQQQKQQQHQQQDDNLLFDVEDYVHVEVDNNGNGNLMNATPPVAATRSTLTPHYAAATKTNIVITPKAVARPIPPCIEQQQRLKTFKPHNDNTSTTTTHVQTVLLQNQVDTLQWQLKQVETSNEMYRAVIEEIARFLDRYLTQKQQQRQLQQQQQMSRSKSLYQVYDGNNSNCEGHEQNTNGDIDTLNDKSSTLSSSSCLRTRSTSNLITDLKQSATKSSNNNTKHTTLATIAVEQKRSCDAINTYNNNSNNNNNNPYTTFKDFTWRRSPKKCAESKALAAANEVEEKLNKEAFRLSRTIQNLLNTSNGQPDLTQHRGALATRNGTTAHSKLSQVLAPTHSTTATMSASTPTPRTTAHAVANSKPNATSDKNNSRVNPPHTANALANNNATANAAEMLFLRANNIRDSRISLRSTTDSSVHSTTSNSSIVSTSSSSAASTSSGKIETDDDVTLHHPFHPLALPYKQLQQHPLNSATEDESGFSSISSFQDIGVPLCSTMISNGISTPNRLSLASVKLDNTSLSNGSGVNGSGGDGGLGIGGGVVCDLEANECVGGDSRNSTLKANHPSNVLGVPLQATHDMQHRWDTTTATTTTMKTNYRSANKYQRFTTLSNEDAAAVLWV